MWSNFVHLNNYFFCAQKRGKNGTKTFSCSGKRQKNDFFRAQERGKLAIHCGMFSSERVVSDGWGNYEDNKEGGEEEAEEEAQAFARISLLAITHFNLT